MFDGILTVIGLAFLLFGLFVFFSAVLGLYRLDYAILPLPFHRGQAYRL